LKTVKNWPDLVKFAENFKMGSLWGRDIVDAAECDTINIIAK